MLILTRRIGETLFIDLSDGVDPSTPVGDLFADGPVEVAVRPVGDGEVVAGGQGVRVVGSQRFFSDAQRPFVIRPRFPQIPIMSKIITSLVQTACRKTSEAPPDGIPTWARIVNCPESELRRSE